MSLKLYRWSAIDHFQQRQKGSLIAQSEQMAQQQLLQRGLQRIKLQRNLQFSTKPKAAEICDLLTQLAILLQSSLPLKNSLLILLQNCQNLQLNQWLRNLLNDIESGLSFSQALTAHQPFLSAQECQLIYVGEMTGKLATVCTQLAQHKTQALKLQRKLQKILLYPLLVLSISLILTLLLLYFVVPQFAEMYSQNQAQLPLFTQVLLSLSQLLRQDLIYLILPLLALILAGKYAPQFLPKFPQYKMALLARLPVISNIIAYSRLVSFCRNLQLMLDSGVTLNQALQSFLPQQKTWQKQVLQGDLLLIEQVQAMLQRLSQGYAFSLAVSSSLFPMQAQQMLQVGEQSGQLPKMLKHIADNYQQQLEHQMDLFSQMLEPLLMLVIGVIIGLIMLGMYLPIFNMGSLIQ